MSLGRWLLSLADILLYTMSFVFLFVMIYRQGFVLTIKQMETVDGVFRMAWMTFLGVNVLHLLLDFSDVRQSYRKITWLLNGLLFLTLLPVFFPSLGFWKGMDIVWKVLQSRIYHSVLLTLLSLFYLSNGFIRLLGRRTNPSFVFVASFFVLIIIGAVLLLLPRATYHGISFVDALFVSTSAVCVTGLSPVDIPTVFTPIGQMVILLLMQIGGLGVMTLTSFFAMFFMGNTSIYNQLAVKDMINSQSLGSLLTTLLYILVFTLTIEMVGALFLFVDIHGTMGMSFKEEVFFVVFHAVSAFCNAGFSTLSGNLGNDLVMSHHNGFYICISILVVLGGIGYPILVNFHQILMYEVKRFYHRFKERNESFRKVHLFNLNTRIVLWMTAFLLGFGTLFLLFAEWNHAFAGMSVSEKVVHAFFNAVCPRTAGFNSISLTSLSVQTIIVYMALMIVGGGTQSTAGGVKVNVFAVVLLNLRAIEIK